MSAEPAAAARDQLELVLADAISVQEQQGDAVLAEFLARLHPDTSARICTALERLGAVPGIGGTGLAGFPPRLGEFRLLRRLGGGGMGVVFLAEQDAPRRRVAVKVVRAELLELPGVRERFRREAEAIARVDHPGIVPVFAVGEQDGLPYFAMELVPGRTLAQVLTALIGRDPTALQGADLGAAVADAGPGPARGLAAAFAGSWWQACVRLGAQVAEAIAHVHAHGIVHRDLKPSNVMVTPEGDARVFDFGLAHVRGDPRLTRTGGGAGSPLYMSPEQVLGEAVDERTDVYSLGVILHELLALAPPFPTDAPDRLRAAQLGGMTASLPLRNPGLPRDLVTVVQKAMDRDRRHRYRDMASFAADLARVLHRQPVAAAPLGLALRGWRLVQRHQAASVVLATVLASAALLPLSLWLWQRQANRELAVEKARAERHFAHTLDTIERLLTRFGAVRLVREPGMELLGLELVGEAVKSYEALLHEEPDNAELRRRYAFCLGELAAAHERLSQPEQAERLLRAGIAELERQDQRDARVARLLAATQITLGRVLYQGGRLDAGRASVTGALARLETLLAAAPEDVAALTELARGVNTLACIAELQGRSAECEALARRDLELERRLVARQPTSVSARCTLALACTNLAQVEIDAGRHAAGDALLGEAIDSLRTTTGGEPDRSVTLAQALTVRGLLVGGEDGLRLLAEAAALRERLVADFSETPLHLHRLAAAEHNYGHLLVQLRRHEAALPWAQRARTHQLAFLERQPDHLLGRQYLRRHLDLLARSLWAVGRHGEVPAVAQDLLLLPDPESAVEAARLFLYCAGQAMAGEREQLRQRSLDALRQAASRGRVPAALFEQAGFEALSDDPEFGALRDRLVGG
jgi:hypothetical protein